MFPYKIPRFARGNIGWILVAVSVLFMVELIIFLAVSILAVYILD